MKLLIIFLLIFNISYAKEGAELVERVAWSFTDTNTTATGSPSDLQYFKYYDTLPDEISMQAFDSMDLTGLEGKNITVGLGIVDPTGSDCKIYPPHITGKAAPVKICLPWWRVERTYQKEFKSVNDLNKFFKYMPKPRPPMLVNYCKEFEKGATFAGGIVTCTTYYDKMVSEDCYNNPKQPKCFVDNCGMHLKENCEYNGMSLGQKETLEWGYEDTGNVQQKVSKVDLKTKQYRCPAGSIVENASCKKEVSSMMYSYQCTPDDPMTAKDDGVYVYCDKENPTYSPTGDIIGFVGSCPDGSSIICDSEVISQEKRVCKIPIMGTSVEERDESVQVTKTYETVSINVVSGEPDIYAQDPNCLRANTTEEARAGIFYARIKGSGSLDDDIFVLTHAEDGTLSKIYCNQQHNGSNPSKVLDGTRVNCIANHGSYSFDQTVEINAADVVTVQQASELDASDSRLMPARNHYNSTALTIEGVLVAPTTVPSAFPYYPNYADIYMKTWENSLSTLSIMFPFSGVYEIYFYSASGKEMGKAMVDSTDFEAMGALGNMQLRLGKEMDLVVPKSSACREDDWVDWGGGVYGGKDSKTGGACSSPNDTYAKGNCVKRLIVKDLLTGAITTIPLVYPLPYPNRIFISKLQLQESRKYRCYGSFPLASPTN